MWPCEAVTKWSRLHFGLWPLQHHDRSLTLYKPSPTRCRPPTRGQCRGHASARFALLARQPGGSEGHGRAQRPQEKTDSIRALRRVKGVFHRKRGGEPMASSTRRRACTGGQRQSYKRAGYLTRSSGPASWGPVGTATEPRSSSWRGRTGFLGGRERGCGCWGTRSAPPPPTSSVSRGGALEGPESSVWHSRLSLVTDGAQPPSPQASWVSAMEQLQHGGPGLSPDLCTDPGLSSVLTACCSYGDQVNPGSTRPQLGQAHLTPLSSLPRRRNL